MHSTVRRLIIRITSFNNGGEKMIHNKKGFSLVETVIAIVIIGIIMGMLIFLINSSNNTQKKTNANIKVLNEISNIYNAFSSLKEKKKMIPFFETVYEIEDIEENEPITLYFNSRMEKTSQEVASGYQIICVIDSNIQTEYTDYTLSTIIKYPDGEEKSDFISPRTIRVGGNSNE